MPPLRALVLEDHAFQRSVAVFMLKQFGYTEVYEAASGEEAIALLQQKGRVDVLLCDLCMEGMDGIDLLRSTSLSDLIGSVVICSSLPLDMRQTAVQIGSLLGFRILGEIAKPLQQDQLQVLLNGVSETSSAPPIPLTSALELPNASDIRRGLQCKEFEAYYQPKFNIKNGTVSGLELLARWNHPTKGILTPASFLIAMEQYGLLDEMFFSLFDQGLNFQRECLSQGMPMKISFNLHAAQLTNRELISRIKTMLNCHNANGRGLIFEITESGLLKAPVISLENLLRLRMLGCGLSIDDFGAGFSSLKRLCQLPFSEIKLDSTFVQLLEQQPRCKAAIKSMQTLSDSLGLALIVKGIETVKQHHIVAALGCTQGQGYLYAIPMAREEVLSWLSTDKVSAYSLSGFRTRLQHGY